MKGLGKAVGEMVCQCINNFYYSNQSQLLKRRKRPAEKVGEIERPVNMNLTIMTISIN